MDQIVTRPIANLKAAAQNSRTHTDEQIAQIAASIERFGWTIPVVIDENDVIIAGHARVRAAKTLKMKEAPCIVAEGWSDTKKEAYQIADNRLAEMSDWDMGILGDQIKRLNAEQFDLGFLDMSGFDLELFKPTLAPKINTDAVTAGQVEGAQEGQDGKFDTVNQKPKQAYDVVCPHCGEEYEITL